MKQEAYSNIIGRKVWDNCKNADIWLNDYFAQIEFKDRKFCDRLDICYDKTLESGEILYVDVIWKAIILSQTGEEHFNLSDLPMEEQKEIFDAFEKEFPNIR